MEPRIATGIADDEGIDPVLGEATLDDVENCCKLLHAEVGTLPVR